VGTRTNTASGKSFPVVNPATLEVIDHVPDMDVTDVAGAIDRAHEALAGWRAAPADDRADILKLAARLIERRADELGGIITLESGKPLAEGRGEALVAAKFLEWSAEEGRRAYGRTIPSPHPDRRYLTIRQPVGVVAALTPWNFPASMVTRKAGAALAAGCTVVLRPAESTPLTCLALARAFADAGLPAHVLEVVTSLQAPPVGDLVTSHDKIAKITFTGSTRVGTMLAGLAAARNKRLSLELGGHAPFIVFPDTDPDEIAANVIASRFRNAGQSCISTNRLIVHRDVADAVAERLSAAVGGLKVGDGMAPGTQIGPLINETALRRIREFQEDAVGRGARLIAGGDLTSVTGLPGAFYAPTVLTEVPRESVMLVEEVFGPLLSISVFSQLAEAVELANATPYGLAAYVFTQDLTTAWRVAEALEFGVIGINDPAPSSPGLPFGGVKASGVGRENGPEGVDAFLETKAISMGLRPAGTLGIG